MKTKSCLDCFNLKVKAGTVWCSKGRLKARLEILPLKITGYSRYRVAKNCEEFEDMDE
jgi:hypothetical protein